jgi:hypothetical protein
LERHPKLRCAFLEGTAGWLYWWLWRLDDQWEKFGPGCEHQLSMMPSVYFKRQCYIALDVDEEPALRPGRSRQKLPTRRALARQIVSMRKG